MCVHLPTCNSLFIHHSSCIPTEGSIISSPASESNLLQWLSTILQYMFTGFWVLPVFWMSKPINGMWFQVSGSVLAQLTTLHWSYPVA